MIDPWKMTISSPKVKPLSEFSSYSYNFPGKIDPTYEIELPGNLPPNRRGSFPAPEDLIFDDQLIAAWFSAIEGIRLE